MNPKNAFTIYPAIDLRGGQVVRLVQGDPHRQTVYSAYPDEVAWRWVLAGAEWLHVVDLDAALGVPSAENLAALGQILAVTRQLQPVVRVQFGGGLRSLPAIAAALRLGVSRVVLGTAAVEDPRLLAKAVAVFGPGRVGVALDGRAGQVQVRGWTRAGGVTAVALGTQLRRAGLRTALYTDIQRDGAGQGVNVAETRRLADGSGLEVIASGGVASLGDVRQARQAGLSGVIIGRALYEGQVRLSEALQC